MHAATDVGGTFTDLVYSIEGDIYTAKIGSTPAGFERGAIHSLEKAKLKINNFEFFAHGSTVIINTITEHEGVKTGPRCSNRGLCTTGKGPAYVTTGVRPRCRG